MHYFSCSGRPGAVYIRRVPGQVMPNMVVLFFLFGWDRYGVDKKCARTCYAELVFFYPVGVAGHVVNSCASAARNINALFFMLEWPQSSFQKKCVGTRYAKLVFLHPMGSMGHVVHSGASRA
jgi:hypothetical protein